MTLPYAEVETVMTDDFGRPNPYRTGYGRQIPTRYRVILAGETKPRRVYAMCYANAATFYVVVKGSELFLHDYDLEGVA